MFGRITNEEIIVEEWVISCRALGRELEDLMAASALSAVMKQAKVAWFHHRTGPRNAPAREWLARIAGSGLDAEGKVLVPISRFTAAMGMPVRIIIHADA
jgi:predicted enzyme involved in methoxymalonyl-ACP biosynthesis